MLRLLILSIVISFHSAVAGAAGLQAVWDRLDAWDGPRHVLLRTDLPNPYASQTYRDIVNGLINRGYVVGRENTEERIPDRPQGLIVELVDPNDVGLVVALIDARDHTLLFVAEIEDYGRGPPGATEGRSGGIGKSMSVRPDDVTAVATEALERLELSGRPKRLAVLTESRQPGYALALLHDDRLQRVHVANGRIASSSSAVSGVKGSRALFLDAGDVDEDPYVELVAVWGQDRDRIGRGTSTAIFGRIFELRAGRLVPESPLLESYLRIIDGAVFAQARAAYEPYGPFILRWSSSESALIRSDGVPHAFETETLYGATPFRNGSYLQWTTRDTLELINFHEGDPAFRGETRSLGNIEHPAVAVPLREPIIIAGPSPTMRRKERFVPLPRRVLTDSAGSAYTIERGRKSNIIGFLEPTGEDRIAIINPEATEIRVGRRYPALEDYILDFGIIKHSGDDPDVVLLVNTTADGSGKTSLVWQRTPRE